MSRLEIFILGSFRATLNGESLTQFEADTARALLAYLALHAPSPCRRETLAGLLWPDQPETAARHNLRQALSRLRKAIGDREADPPFLLITRKTIQLNPEGNYWLDVVAFDDLIATCRGHRHRRLEACRSCVQRLREATALYRGDLMAGFSLNSAPFETRLVTERERRHRQLLHALRHLAAYHESRAEYEQVQRYARQQLALEPWREDAHRQLMRALALGGQRAAALSQYGACCRALAEELDVEPEEGTMALHERIRDGKLNDLAHPPLHNLPAPVTPFVGREAEMAAIAERLQDPDCRLLTLTGPGGIGKTRLTLEAASAQVDAFEHGVFVVPLAPLQSPEAIVPATAQALGLSFYVAAEEGEETEPRQQLLNYVREKSMLLVLDNYEHLLAFPEHSRRACPERSRRACPERSRRACPERSRRNSVDLVTDVLRAAPDVCILVTSRERLNVQGEHLFPVAGIDVPEQLLATGAGPMVSSAIRLFLHSARRARPDFEPVEEDLVEVGQICRLVEGMPLAILLAAAWVEMLTPAEIAAQIEGQTSGLGIDVLETDLRDVPERHRSIRAVFDHSWELLTEREQEMYQALSVFRGGFTRKAARQVTSATLRKLMSLAHKSLLHCVPTERFKMHELLRQYAAEKLAQDPGAREAARERHCAYYTAALQGWAADLKGPQQQATLAEMDAEGENACAAWDWMAEERQIGRLDRAIDGLCLFYDWRGRYLEGEAACRTAATRLGSRASGDELASAPPPTLSVTGGMDAGSLPDQVSARILAWQGVFSDRLGRKEAAGQLLHQATVLLRQPDQTNAGDARRGGAFVPQPTTRNSKPPTRNSQPPTHSTRDIRRGEAFVPLHIGRLMVDTDRREARRLCARGLALYRAWGDRWEAANALSALGRAAGSLGAYGEAERALEESLAIRRALGDRRGIGDALQGLADVAERQGRFEQAERLTRKTIALHREIGDRAGVATGLHELGGISLYLGKYVQARSSLEESPAIYENLGTRSMVAHTNMLLGHIRMALGQYERAHTRGQAALALSRKIDFRRGIGTSLLLLCCVALAKGRYAEARRQLKESVAIYREIGHRHDLSAALAFLGYAARGLGDLEEARQRLCESLRLAAEIGAFIPRMIALPAMALLLADRGETERAVSLYALASRHPFVARSRWFEDVARRHIAVAAAILPPDVVAAAQERGRARDLDATIGELLDENVEQFHS